MITEMMMAALIDVLQVPAATFRASHFYKQGDLTHFNQVLDEFQFDRIWQEINEWTGYEARLEAALEFNRNHTHTKRGLALVLHVLLC